MGPSNAWRNCYWWFNIDAVAHGHIDKADPVSGPLRAVILAPA